MGGELLAQGELQLHQITILHAKITFPHFIWSEAMFCAHMSRDDERPIIVNCLQYILFIVHAQYIVCIWFKAQIV